MKKFSLYMLYFLLALSIAGCKSQADGDEVEVEDEDSIYLSGIITTLQSMEAEDEAGKTTASPGLAAFSTASGNEQSAGTDNSAENKIFSVAGGSVRSTETDNNKVEAITVPEAIFPEGKDTTSSPGLTTLSPASGDTQSARMDDNAGIASPSGKMLSSGRPLLTLKTNLLYDLTMTPHIGIEVPIGERFSVGAEFMRGWWLRPDWSFCWQLEAATLEGRYWFAPLMERYERGGWFAGTFVQAGFYDLQFHSNRGVQGEAFMAGLSGGYLYPRGDSWSLEFSFGAGYLCTGYSRYSVAPTHNGHQLVKSAQPMRLTGYLYPLKAGISVQWTIQSSKTKRRVK
jgi:hypothetical protein